MSGRVTRALVGLSAVLSFLPATAHEATHTVAGRLLADDAGLHVEVAGAEAHASIRGLDEAARWAAAVVCLAPTILGTWLAIIVFAWWVLAGYSLPAVGESWAKLALAALVWSLYTAPSGQDLGLARHYASGGDDDAG